MNALRQVATDLLVHAVRESNSELLRLYWELMYLYRFGLPKIPPLFDPNRPAPDPVPDSIYIDSRVFDSIIAKAVHDPGFGTLFGDPTPQPNLDQFGGVRVRLDAAQALCKRLVVAVKELEHEIAELTKCG